MLKGNQHSTYILSKEFRLYPDTVFVTVPCGYRSQRESFTNFFKCRELLSWLDSFPTYQPRSRNWSLQLRVRLIKIRICIRKESGICDTNLYNRSDQRYFLFAKIRGSWIVLRLNLLIRECIHLYLISRFSIKKKI